MRKAPRLCALALALLGSTGLAAAQNNPDTGQINRGAGEATRPPTGAPAGVMQQSGPGDKVGDVPASNTPSGAFPNAGAATPAGAAAEASTNSGSASAGPIGATEQTMPSKFSPKNAALDKTPIMAQPLNLTAEEQRMVYQSLAADTDTAVRALEVDPANVLPADVALRDLPEKVTDQVPRLKGYKFVKLPDKIVIVSAPNRIVVGEIRP